MITFKNLNISPMSDFEPKWQKQIMEQINAEYQERALKISEEIRFEFEEIQSRIQPGFYAMAFENILKKIPRYAFIKNIKDNEGSLFDAQIDLALHTVTFIYQGV